MAEKLTTRAADSVAWAVENKPMQSPPAPQLPKNGGVGWVPVPTPNRHQRWTHWFARPSEKSSVLSGTSCAHQRQNQRPNSTPSALPRRPISRNQRKRPAPPPARIRPEAPTVDFFQLNQTARLYKRIRLYILAAHYAGIAQLVEQLTCNQ